MSTVEAIVATIHTEPLPGADNLVIGRVAGHQVVTNKATKDGTLGIFIPPDARLSAKYCHENNLYKHKELNKDQTQVGYIDDNGKVRTIKLRNTPSEGIFMPMSSVSYTGTGMLVEGSTFTELNGFTICEKYYTPATLKARGATQAKQGKESACPMFKKHYDTENLRYYASTIESGTELIITEKLHGTSGRTGFVLVAQPQRGLTARWNSLVRKAMSVPQFPFTRRWLDKLYIQPKTKWDFVSGTRNTVLANNFDDGWHKGNFRRSIHDHIATLNLHRGETLYYEIVGWEGEGLKPIMAPHALTKDDAVRKQLAKRYQTEKMVYSYGCQPGQYMLFVYRITRTSTAGETHELTWKEIEKRCVELGLLTVPVLTNIIMTTTDMLLNLCGHIVNGQASIVDTAHISEGCCVRIDSGPKLGKAYKYKSFEFLVLEDLAKANDDYIDAEEIS